jgi:MtN3 and saliva related transmembrane protein
LLPIDGLVTVLTTIVSVAVKVVGLPDQIKSNHERKSTNGLSGWFVMSAFLSYILWTIHGFIQHGWSLIIGQGLGVATTGVIVVQIFLYRDQTKKKKTKLTAGTLVLGLGIIVRTKRKVRTVALRGTEI